MNTQVIISKEELLKSWQLDRALTRKTIERFPEDELFKFSIGGMRTYADIIKELISIAAPGLRGIVSNQKVDYNHNLPLETKQEILDRWDADTKEIDDLYSKISDERFHEEFAMYGELRVSVIQSILYFKDNEIHHRGQGYVYLRALGIEPPFFWERY